MQPSSTKAQPSLKKGVYLLWVSIAGLLANLVGLIVPENVVPIFTSTCGGLDFGCSLGGAYGAMLLGLAAAAVVSGVILRKCRLHQPKSVGFLTPVPTFAAMFALIDYLSTFIAGSTSAYLRGLLIAAVFIPVFIAHNLLLLRLGRWFFRLILVILLCAFYVWPVMSFFQQQANEVHQASTDNAGRNAPFSFYQPTSSVLEYPVTSSYYWRSGNLNREPYHEIRYGRGGDSISLNLFKVPDTYNPPANCGNEKPEFTALGDRSIPCEEIGKSKSGCTVYAAKPTRTNSYATYCQLGNTLVTTHTTTSYSRSKFRDEHAVALYDSLQKSSYDSLRMLKQAE